MFAVGAGAGGVRVHKTDPFYWSAKWKRKRAEVLKRQNYECQYCKAKGLYVRATHVHHEFPRDKYPQYELIEYVSMPDGTYKRNLTACCRQCHETVGHPGRLGVERKPQLTEEWW